MVNIYSRETSSFVCFVSFVVKNFITTKSTEAAKLKNFCASALLEQHRNYLEDKCVGIRLPSQKFAEAILR